jgi:hypothetical protein
LGQRRRRAAAPVEPPLHRCPERPQPAPLGPTARAFRQPLAWPRGEAMPHEPLAVLNQVR